MIHKEEIVITLCLGFSPYITRVAFRGGGGGGRRGAFVPPPCWMFAPLLRFYYIYCNVQHVALATPAMRKQLFCPPPTL